MANQGNPPEQNDTDPQEPTKLTRRGAVQHAITGDTVTIKGSVRRRCEGTNRQGERCKGFALHTDSLCRVHAMLRDNGGQTRFGSLTPQESGAKSGRVRQAQVHLRQTVFPTGRITPRTALKALAVAKSTHLAARAIEAALEGEPTPAKGSLALRIVEVADPGMTAEVSFDASASWEDVAGLPDEAKRKWLLSGLGE